MISYFSPSKELAYVVEHQELFSQEEIAKLLWLFECPPTNLPTATLSGEYIGPRVEMVSPWSTNAVEIAQDMGVRGITRIEPLRLKERKEQVHDPMLEALYHNPSGNIFEALAMLHHHSLHRGYKWIQSG